MEQKKINKLRAYAHTDIHTALATFIKAKSDVCDIDTNKQ